MYRENRSNIIGNQWKDLTLGMPILLDSFEDEVLLSGSGEIGDDD
jgi:hypothetical protein